MDIKLKQLKEKQEEIEAFWESAKAQRTKAIAGVSLRKWVVDSVVHFMEVGVDINIIDLFIKRCEFQKDDKGNGSHGIFQFRILKRGYILRSHGESGDGSPFIIPVEVALRTSRMLIDRYEEEERIIPGSLIGLFNNEKYQSIKLSLESIESNYQTKDPCGMLSSLITATELICKLIPELERERNVGSCLKKIYKTELSEKYNINKEIVWALNNARIIRNEEVAHIKAEHNGNVPMYEIVGYAHLLVLFVDSLFASGIITLDRR